MVIEIREGSNQAKGSHKGRTLSTVDNLVEKRHSQMLIGLGELHP